MNKVFLTGATGFIGGNLVDHLLEEGYKVKVLIRDDRNLKPYKWKDSVEIIYGDITDENSFKDNISDCNIVIHSAALIAWWNKDWDKIYRVNVLGTRNIATAAMNNKIEKLVHISSVAAVGYGEKGESINEEHPYNWGKHKIVYMETKHEAENEIYKAIKQGLNATIVNPANVWGKGDYRGRRTKLIKALNLGFPFYTYGGTNFVDVDAVCKATINAIKHGKCGERYILGGDNLSTKDFLGIIATEINARKPFIQLPLFCIKLSAYAQELIAPIFRYTPKPTTSQIGLFNKYVYYDSSKAQKELKMPVISFKECIQKTIRFYKENNLI